MQTTINTQILDRQAANRMHAAWHSPYLHRYGAPDGRRGRLKLYLLPYAGGSASIFRNWPGHFDDSVELVGIQLPGRGSRMGERAETDHRVLVRDIADAVQGDGQCAGFALYGHSMGALLAYHVGAELARRGAGQPECLFLSGCKPPHLPREQRHVGAMSDADFLGELRRMDGTPAILLDNAELMQLLLPTIKADFMLLDSWYRELGAAPLQPDGARQPALSAPIVAMAGRRDQHCSAADIAGWRDYTDGAVEILEYSGGHFFLQGQEARVADDIRERLAMQRRGA